MKSLLMIQPHGLKIKTNFLRVRKFEQRITFPRKVKSKSDKMKKYKTLDKQKRINSFRHIMDKSQKNLISANIVREKYEQVKNQIFFRSQKFSSKIFNFWELPLLRDGSFPCIDYKNFSKHKLNLLTKNRELILESSLRMNWCNTNLIVK